eukprot:3804618-Pleurochrysis_carterae.AAC.2
MHGRSIKFDLWVNEDGAQLGLRECAHLVGCGGERDAPAHANRRLPAAAPRVVGLHLAALLVEKQTAPAEEATAGAVAWLARRRQRVRRVA